MTKKYYYLFYVGQHGKVYLDNIGRWVIDISKADIVSRETADSMVINYPFAKIGVL